MSRTYKRGAEFPNEGFIQSSIEAFFCNAGFRLDNSGTVDLFCEHPTTNETWHIEAKGQTKHVGLDFRTCLGQLIQRMQSQNIRYGIALPDTPEFHTQVQKLSGWVVSALGIHWLFVSKDGAVRIEAPACLAPHSAQTR